MITIRDRAGKFYQILTSLAYRQNACIRSMFGFQKIGRLPAIFSPKMFSAFYLDI
jgi:hypothetical protein